MARVVSPWTWAKMLRYYGPSTNCPESRDFLVAMHTLRTFVNGDNFTTFVGLRAWAKGARMAVNTLQKHRQRTIDEGWLHVSTSAGDRGERLRCQYRCTVPDYVVLDEKDEEDEEIALGLVSRHGDGESSSVAAKRDTDSRHAAQSVSLPVDTDARSTARAMQKSGEGHAVGVSSVSTPAPICVNRPTDLYQTAGPSVSAPGVIRKSSEVPIEVCSEGAGASARTALAKNDDPDERCRVRSARAMTRSAGGTRKIEKLARLQSHLSDGDIAKITGEPVEAVTEVRRSMESPG